MHLNGLRPSGLTPIVGKTGRLGFGRIVLGWAAVSLLAGASVPAQSAKMPEFGTIRKQPDLAGIDRTNVETWVNQQIQQLFAAPDDKTVQSIGREFYQAVVQNIKAGDATPKFREGLATIVANSFVKQYKPDKTAAVKRRPQAPVYVLMTLGQIAQPTPGMFEAFTLGLSDSAPGGRMMAAVGLLAIRDQLNAQQWATLLPALQKAGTTEFNNPSLSSIYHVLAVGQGPQAAQNAPVVLAILEDRLTRFEQKKGWPLAADGEAIKWLADAMAAMAAPQQQKATLVMARVLTNAVYAYVGKPGEDRLEGLEKAIMAAESQLKKVVAARAPSVKLPAPDVTAVMLENSPSQTEAMLLALNKWIGTAQEAGVLNGPPFSFERGLKIAPPPPALHHDHDTTSAPAGK